MNTIAKFLKQFFIPTLLLIGGFHADTVLAAFTSGNIYSVAGMGTGISYTSGDNGPATSAMLNQPSRVAVDSAGNLYIADAGNHRVRKVVPDGTITTVAGSGSAGYSGDKGAATSAKLNNPQAVAVDAAGNLYIADAGNVRIRKVSTGGTITTVAGNGSRGYSGDNGPATSAQLSLPGGVTVDSAGNLYIADQGNHYIRKLTTSSGIITTVAGNGTAGSFGLGGYSGDGGPATSAALAQPSGVAVDSVGDLYIADVGNSRIRKVALDGTITTVAGNGTAGYSGDNGAATAAMLNYPRDIAVDGAGNLYIADFNNQRIRKVTASTGTITTVAGNGTAGYSGDNASAATSMLSNPEGVTIDNVGNLYIADAGNGRIRMLANGAVPTLAAQTIGAISFSPANLTVGGTTTASATASSGLAVSFSSMTPNNCMVSGSTVTGIAAGTCTVAADQSGNASYSAAPQVTQSIQLSQSATAQTIGLISFSTATIAVGGSTTASATASSGLAVSFSSMTPNNCMVSGNTVTGVAPGTCIVAANQAGNATYSAAPQMTQSIADVIPALTLAKSGTGSGNVTSTDGSINCGSTCSATYNSVTSVTITAIPAFGSTFSGWNGACTGTGICTLSVDAIKNVTASFNIIPFTAVITGVTAGIITAPVATVTATVSFNTADKGKPQSVFITAWAPLNTLSKAQQASIASYTTMVKPFGTSASTTFVLVQLTQSGWQPVVNGQLIPYVTGVTSEQAAAVKILDNTSTANLLGSQFCVGYGTSAADMTSNGRMQLVATIANSNVKTSNTGSCNVALPISNTRAFAFAESNYTNFFWGVYTADQIDYQGNHFDYRYYPVTQNYLAVDPSGMVWVLGPVSGGTIQSVGPLESFRNAITAWEGVQ